MDDDVLHARVNTELQFDSFKKECSEMKLLLETYSQNITAAQAKIEVQTVELATLRDTAGTIARSRIDATNHKERMTTAIESGMQKIGLLQVREKHNRSQINELLTTTENLKFKVEQSTGWSDEQEAHRRRIMEQIEALTRSIESKKVLSLASQSETKRLQKVVDQEDLALDRECAHVSEIYAQVEVRRGEARQEQCTKLALDEQLQQGQVEVGHHLAVSRKLANGDNVEETEIADTEAHLFKSKQDMELNLKEYEKLFKLTQQLTEQLESLMYANETTENDDELLRHHVTEMEQRVTSLATQVKQTTKAKESMLKKLSAVEKLHGLGVTEREGLRASIMRLETCEIRLAWREGETYKKQLEDLGREQEILSRNFGTSETTSRLIFDLIKVNQNAKKNLQNEIRSYTRNIKLQRAQIEDLVQENERHEREAKGASRKYYVALEQLKLQEVQISEIHHKIVDHGARLKQQRNLYDAAQCEKNLNSKSLVKSQELIADMQRQFKIMSHRIEQLKQEITIKDRNLVKEHFNHHNVVKECEFLGNELTKIKKQIVSSEQIILNQRTEIQKITQITQEADEQRQRQRKEYDALVGEDKILSSQLTQRNQELGSVYAKIKAHWSILQRGESCYAEKATELRLLTKHVHDKQRKGHDSALQMISIKDLHQTHLNLERKLLHERHKNKALRDKLERPINVHRWRILESSDPQRFEMLKAINNLQKQIILKTGEILEKDSLIQNKEGAYIKLKNFLSRQHGQEATGRLIAYQNNLREKRDQMKAMMAELKMYQQQVATFRSEIDSIACNLDTVKAGWIRGRLTASAGCVDG